MPLSSVELVLRKKSVYVVNRILIISIVAHLQLSTLIVPLSVLLVVLVALIVLLIVIVLVVVSLSRRIKLWGRGALMQGRNRSSLVSLKQFGLEDLILRIKASLLLPQPSDFISQSLDLGPTILKV